MRCDRRRLDLDETVEVGAEMIVTRIRTNLRRDLLRGRCGTRDDKKILRECHQRHRFSTVDRPFSASVACAALGARTLSAG